MPEKIDLTEIELCDWEQALCQPVCYTQSEFGQVPPPLQSQERHFIHLQICFKDKYKQLLVMIWLLERQVSVFQSSILLGCYPSQSFASNELLAHGFMKTQMWKVSSEVISGNDGSESIMYL